MDVENDSDKSELIDQTDIELKLNSARLGKAKEKIQAQSK